MTENEKQVREIDPQLDYFRETGIARIVMCEIDGKYIPELSPFEEPPEELKKVLQDERTPVIHGWRIQGALDMAKLIYKYNDMEIKALASPPLYEQLTSGEYDLTDIELEPSKWVWIAEHKSEIWLFDKAVHEMGWKE